MSALVAFVLVNDTVPIITTSVALCLANGPPEEAFAAVTRGRTIVLSRGTVPANCARPTAQVATGRLHRW
jgi:hypothetical protein